MAQQESGDIKIVKDTSQLPLVFLDNVCLKLSVELGRTKISIKDLLLIQKGSIIELEKLAGEPSEILINSRTISRGEVMVIGDKFSIRLTDIIDPDEGEQKILKSS